MSENFKIQRWVMGIVSTIMVAGIIAIFSFVYDVSKTMSYNQASQSQINLKIVERLEDVEDGLKSYIESENDRWDKLSERLIARTDAEYTIPDSQRDLEILRLQTDLKIERLKLQIIEQGIMHSNKN